MNDEEIIKCGVVFDRKTEQDIMKMLKQARDEERKELLEKIDKLFEEASDTVWLTDFETMYDAIHRVCDKEIKED